jgi:hypothetical protein
MTPCGPSWQRTYCTANGQPVDPLVADAAARRAGLNLRRGNAADVTLNGVDRAHQVFVVIDLGHPGCLKVSASAD